MQCGSVVGSLSPSRRPSSLRRLADPPPLSALSVCSVCVSVYSLVSYKSAVQAEATTPGLTGNFSEVAKMLVKVSSEAQRSGRRMAAEATDRRATRDEPRDRQRE